MRVESEMAGGRLFPRLHWGAVIAGVLLAIAAHIVMGLVGGTLGFVAVPADSRAVGAAAAIWALITPFVATLLGAWLACRMSASDDNRSSNLHAILVWCIGLIAGAVFLTGTVASGAMTAGATAAGGNVSPVARMFRGDVGTRPGARAATEARQDEAARAAAAGFGGAALASIAGLLGAVVGAGLSRSRARGKGRGWRIAIQRPEEVRPGPVTGQERGYAGTYPPPSPPRAPGAPEVSGPPTDPYHH